MKLKKITIHGFKSFADKVTLDFDCEIVGIVGPNGCGKSNIVDAIRWVMGEQSAKSLRGDKMHDVLFAGTDQRQPLNYAEVSVTLTDIGDSLPIPYEEVTIARRLFRSGESEYYINKELVRLKDVQGLLLGSGIGKNAFSIFEQGKLDQIIHWSPLERRMIFDEAAGTSRFLLRKKETLRKLTTVNDNFTRVRDIHAEIEKQAKQLKKQATHAKSYQDNKQKLETLEKNVLLSRWKTIAEKHAGISEKTVALQATIQEKQSEISLFENALEQAKQGVVAEEILAKQKLKELNQAETKSRLCEAEISQNKQRLLEIKKREESVKSHLLTLGQEQEAREAEIRLKEEQLHRLTQESASTDLKEALKKSREEHLKKMQEESRKNSELKEKIFRFEAKSARWKALTAFENSHAVSTKKIEEKIALQKEKVSGLTTEIDSFKEELLNGEKELLQLRKQHAEMQKEEQALLRQITEIAGHHKALNRLKEELEGFSAGAKLLLKEAKNDKSPLYENVEPLFEYLVPHKGYEEILASSMKAYVETLVVPSEEIFEELLNVAKKKKISDFSVVIKSRLKKAIADVSPRSLAKHLNDHLMAYHFTSHFELTEDGHFYDALGVFFHAGSGKKLNNAFYRQAELKTLAETLAALQQKGAQHAAALEAVTEKMKWAEKRRNEMSEVRRKKEMDLVRENFELQQAIQEQEKLKKEIVSLKKEQADLSHLEEEAIEIEKLKASAEGMKDEVLALHKALKQLEGLFEKWQESRQQVEIHKAKQQQSILHERKMREELEELRIRVETIVKTVAQQEKEGELIHASLYHLQQSVKEQEKTLGATKKECEIQEKELVQKRKLFTTLEKEAHAFEVIAAQDFSAKKSIEDELSARHGLMPEGLPQQQIELEEGLENATKEILRLRSALESAGAVNMTAIEEFQETQARFDHIDQQLKDLEESKKDLEEITLKLDQESRKIFRKTFQQIRENFQKNFAILFNGGSADLTFTESSDILEAGIEIVAKPPGKQLRAISLLSGGEKCLTALALLFSLFEVRPAPFCILDEVDAPLDESNIDRFTNVLQQFVDKTQFLIVTHNKKTMAIADLLIGVSMEEKGVSKLISLAFEKKAPHSVLRSHI